jgi:O-antigen/teichoic acid export membrane protein
MIHAVSYGARSLPGVLAVLLNGRLDQLLMVALSSARELGLYAVAVTLAGAPGRVIGALASAIFPRVAAGEVELVARASRLSLAATLVVSVLVAAISYPTLLLLFGSEFVASMPMVLILLVSGLPAAGSLVLGYSLRSLGRPGTVSAVDAFGLAITIPGALVLIPWLGGVGAAIVTLSANLVIFLGLLATTQRILGLTRREYLRVGPEEIQEAIARLAHPLVAWLRRRRSG